MFNRPFSTVLTRLAIVAAILATLLLMAPAASAATKTISYAENGTDPVARFSATDQDGDDIVWSLTGDDAARFTIDGGVLAFKKSPDYEKPNSKATGSLSDRNVYKVTVNASGGSQDVEVTVTDVDEAGTVSFSGEGRFQPQVGRSLEANLSDQDGGVSDATWQWARSADKETWTDIAGATSQNRSPVGADEGMYLRASVAYTDSFGSGKTASGVTANAVEARTVANAKPSFSGQDDDDNGATPVDGIQVNRSVDEGTAAGSSIGKPVSASDADNDVLVYTLSGGADKAKFSISASTGQIKAKTKLNFESGAGAADNCTADDACVVTVTATDPSGASASQDVKIEIENVNEAPAFTAGANVLKVLNVLEGTTALRQGTGSTAVGDTPYVATDEDTDDTTVTYAVEGADQKNFNEAASGTLAFATGHTPNYEDKSSYSITVVATAGAGGRLLRTRVDVKVNVVDQEDTGSVGLSQREPQVGRAVVATASDPDGGVIVSAWQWQRSDVGADDSDGNPTAATCSTAAYTGTGSGTISGASSAVYTPKAADVNRCLRATATYTDNIGTASATAVETSERAVQAADPANTAPEFPDQDPTTPGDQSDSTSRSVAENTKEKQPIGNPVSADDTDLLLYTMSGADADSFSIDKKTGQLKTKGKLDYETKNVYTFTVTATDPSTATDTITVTINVTDANDGADITGVKSVSYEENGTDPVATFVAADQDEDEIVWSLDGDDKARFKIDGGVLTFKKSPDYEKPNSQASGSLADRNVYRVTAKASGGKLDVVVTVTDVDEAGTVSFGGEGRYQPQVGRGLSASLTDQDGGLSDATWQWARSADKETWTDIAGATSQSRSPVGDDVGMYLRASVAYTDSFGSGKTAEGVTANAVEARTVANAKPSFSGQDDDDNGDTALDGIQVNRKVDENSAAGSSIGKPVSASDADNDVLVYTLSAGTDKDRFSISASTGQIKVKQKLNFEGTNGSDSTDNCGGGTANACVVTVKATDPSGASATQEVKIAIQDVNEAPVFDAGSNVLKVLNVVENTSALRQGAGTTALGGDNYDADDKDADLSLGGNATSADNEADAALTLEGTDAKYFDLTDQGALTIDTNQDNDDTTENDYLPNYEKQSSYSITIVATSGKGARLLRTKVDVTINVVDSEDAGTVTLSQREPQIGRAVIATLSDPDGGVIVSKWQWARSADLVTNQTCAGDATGWADITNASSSVYTPTDDDDGACLRASVTYMDNIPGDSIPPDTNDDDGDNDDTDQNSDGITIDAVSERPVQESDPANTAPKFPDQDPSTPGDQSDSTSRSVAENTKAGVTIGGPVSADDTDLLLYALSGADAASFSIDKKTGQLKTKAKLDYETKTTYMVTVTATDPSGATDSIDVTINVTDVDDGATIILRPTVNTDPAFDADTASRSVGENMASGANVGDPVTATDDDAGDSVAYSLSGTDSASFMIDSATGQITTTMMHDYETTMSYMVTVTATDQEGATDTVAVTINVTDAHAGCAVDDNTGLTNDCEALLDSKGDLQGTSTALSGWIDHAHTPIGDWQGVTVDDDSMRVTGLDLRGGNLSGTVPAALGRLDALETLNLRSNSLTGSIPAELGGLTNLTYLNLHSNDLTGSIPDLSGLTMLEELYLQNNDLTGGIPAWLNGMTSIEELWLWGNPLGGEVPDLSGMSGLVRVKLQSTGLTGGMKSTFNANLQYLNVGSNALGGTIPDLSGLTNLRSLWLHASQLTGEIPASLGTLTNLRTLNLRNNQLSGSIPDLGGLDNLTHLRLHRNTLSGSIPGSLGGLEALQYLWLHGNGLTGTIPAELDSLADTLVEINLMENSFDADACLPAALATALATGTDNSGLDACATEDGS